MKRALCIGSLCLALVSCGKQSEQAHADAKKEDNGQQQQAKTLSNDVKIKPDIQRKVGLNTARVQTRPVLSEFAAPGQIMLNEEHTVHVGSYADGRVVELDATVGAHVQKGAVLARLHSHSVHETRAALASAAQEVTRQEEVVEYRRRMHDRMQRLLALKSASPQEVERSQSELQSAEADLRNAHINQQKETVHLADLLRVPETNVESVDEHTELAPILAPISGVVTERKITVGTIVEPGQETFVITNLSSVWMIASVSETDLPKLHTGSRARVISQAYPDEDFRGTVSFIAPEVDPQTRTLQARIVLPNTGHKLHPGMFANAEIAEGSSRPATFIPERAIQDLNGGSVVFAQVDGTTFQPQPVKIAHRLNGEAEITAGVKPGDVIVTDGSFVVKSELLKSQIGQ